MWSPSNFSPPGPRFSRPLVHRGGHALGVEGKFYKCQYQLRGKRPTCRRTTTGRGHRHGDSVDSVASMSGGPTQAPADGELVHRPVRSRGFKTCLPASGPRPGTLAVGKDQIRSLDRTTCFLASEALEWVVHSASEGPHSVPTTSRSSQPVATPRSAPGRASRLWLEKLGQSIKGWPGWRARGLAVAAIVAGTGSPPTGAAVAAGPTTLDGQTDWQPSQGYRGAAYPKTVRRTATPGRLTMLRRTRV